jgi:hypothetical protein
LQFFSAKPDIVSDEKRPTARLIVEEALSTIQTEEKGMFPKSNKHLWFLILSLGAGMLIPGCGSSAAIFSLNNIAPVKSLSFHWNNK